MSMPDSAGHAPSPGLGEPPPPTLDEVVAQIFQMLDDNIQVAITASVLFAAPSAGPSGAAADTYAVLAAGSSASVALVGVHDGAHVLG